VYTLVQLAELFI